MVVSRQVPLLVQLPCQVLLGDKRFHAHAPTSQHCLYRTSLEPHRGTFGLQQPGIAFKRFSAHLPLLTLGALEYQLIGVRVALCAKSVADSMVGGETAGGTFKGLLASLTVQHPTPVHSAEDRLWSQVSWAHAQRPGSCRRWPQASPSSKLDDLKRGRLQESHLSHRAVLLCGELSVKTRHPQLLLTCQGT